MSEHMSYLEDGWVTWARGTGLDSVDVCAQLCAEKEGGRGQIVQLLLSGRNLTTDRLRSIPLAHIENLANTNPAFTPHIKGDDNGLMAELVKQFHDEASQQINEVSLTDSVGLTDAATIVNPATIATAARIAAVRGRAHEPLARPDGSNPDAFYRHVAEAYRDVLQTTNKVAKVLAEEANVPVGTVHRWIMEARRRGFLPAARQGRAG
jgi:hypothetical protein